MHLIKKHILDIECASQSFGKEVQTAIAGIMSKELYPKLELLFDLYSVTDYARVIDQITIQLPTLSKKNWKSEFVANALIQIEEYLKLNSYNELQRNDTTYQTNKTNAGHDLPVNTSDSGLRTNRNTWKNNSTDGNSIDGNSIDHISNSFNPNSKHTDYSNIENPKAGIQYKNSDNYISQGDYTIALFLSYLRTGSLKDNALHKNLGQLITSIEKYLKQANVGISFSIAQKLPSLFIEKPEALVRYIFNSPERLKTVIQNTIVNFPSQEQVIVLNTITIGRFVPKSSISTKLWIEFFSWILYFYQTGLPTNTAAKIIKDISISHFYWTEQQLFGAITSLEKSIKTIQQSNQSLIELLQICTVVLLQNSPFIKDKTLAISKETAQGKNTAGSANQEITAISENTRVNVKNDPTENDNSTYTTPVQPNNRTDKDNSTYTTPVQPNNGTDRDNSIYNTPMQPHNRTDDNNSIMNIAHNDNPDLTNTVEPHNKTGDNNSILNRDHNGDTDYTNTVQLHTGTDDDNPISNTDPIENPKNSNTPIVNSNPDSINKREDAESLDIAVNETRIDTPNKEPRKNHTEASELQKILAAVNTPVPLPISHAAKRENSYIENAGLVIIHPFLTTLFELTGLYQNKEWTSDYNWQKAILLTQYLVSGQTKIVESELLLNKFLCGFPAENVLNTKIKLTKKDRDICNDVLLAVIEYWSVLKNTSPEALRETFLMRKAKMLVKNTTAELWVEQKGYDILLQQLPWGISMVKTPWMEDFLQCNWN